MKTFCIVGAVAVLAGAAWADSLPDAVGGVLTLEVGSGTVTYDGAVPSSVTKVIKTGAGEAVLSVASTSFAGEAEVQGGTLTLSDTDYKALGSGRPVTVKSGATLAFKGRTAKSQEETIYYGALTIEGDGVGSLGALYWAPTDGSTVLSDAAYKSIVLSADATIGGTKRHGSRSGTLDLAGHTLKMRSVDYMFNTTVVKGPGRFEKTEGATLYIQNAVTVSNGDHTDTFIRSTKGAISLWGMDRFLDATIEMNGGAVQIGSGNYLSGKNHFAALKILGSNRNIGFQNVDGTPREVTIRGDIDMNTYTVQHSYNDVVWHNGSFLNPTTDTGVFNQNGGLFIYTNSAVTSVLPQTFVYGGSTDGKYRAPGIECRGGNVQANFLRIGPNSLSGSVRTSAGTFNGGSAAYCGQGGGLGAIMVDGGTFSVRGMNLSSSKYGHSVVRQTGGRIENMADSTQFQLGTGGGWAGMYMTGGTNATRRSIGQNERVNLAYSSNSVARLVISGTNTLLETEKLYVGKNADAGAEDILITLRDGGTLAADRLSVASSMPPGSRYCAVFDGGVIMPYFGYAWAGAYFAPDNPDAFAKICPQRGVVFGGGAVLDMSKSTNDKGVITTVNNHINLRFDAPEGRSITSIALPDSVKDIRYGVPVPISIESDTGYGADALAEVDYISGKLTGITVYSGGCNYDENTKVYIYSNVRKSGSLPDKIECSYTLSDATPACGPLIKRGQSVPWLFATNTYTGGTIVEEGKIVFATQVAFPSNTAVRLGKPDQCGTASVSFARYNDAGAAFDVTFSRLSGYGEILSAKSLTITEGIGIDAKQLFTNSRKLQISMPLVFTAGAKVSFTDPENVPDLKDAGRSRAFLTATSITGTPELELPASLADKWRMEVTSTSLMLVPMRGTVLILR